MATFLPDDKHELIEQLNTLNKTNVPDADVNVTASVDGQQLTGTGSYTGTATVNKPKRSFATLFPFGAIVKKETGNEDVTGRAALALMNERYQLSLPESYFTDESLNTTYQLGTWNSISAQIALEPTEDNPYWEDTLFISLYRSTLGGLGTYGVSSSSSIYVDLGKDDVAITTEFSEAAEDSWDGLFLKAQLTAAGGQFEFNPTAKQIVRQVSYFASIDYNVRVEDANGWRWWQMLPATTARNTLTLSATGWTLSGYQPNHADTDPKPSAPVWGDGSTEILFLPDDSDIAEGIFKLYAINNPPSTYATDDGYTMLFTLKAIFEAEGTLRVGDCTIVNQRLDPLPYTPGIIPFSNNYIPNAPTFDSWRGQPYPGYQHPWVFLDMDVSAERRDLMIQNVVNFWYDSQQWYYQKFGVLGPGASAYVWDRWDAPSGSKVNDFTMYHFGDQTAWSGYQPRAFFSAVRLYAGLLDHGLAVPEKLTTYISYWIDFLFTYQQENAYQSPTDFPMDKPPAFIPNDFTGHMAGLWLAGASLAMLYGHPNDKGYPVAVNVYNEIVENYINRYTVDDAMNGGWSPAPDSANLGRDGMYFGFWSGEILRGLGYYIALLRDVKPTI